MIVGVIVGGLLAGWLTVTPSAAYAASSNGVPPQELPECDANSEYGGWDKRDITSNGTTGTNENYPIRPLVVRAGEPCVNDATGDYANDLMIPWMNVSPPTPMIDADEDGEDDPPPSGVSTCSPALLTNTSPTSVAEVAERDVICNGLLTGKYGSPVYTNGPIAEVLSVTMDVSDTNSVRVRLTDDYYQAGAGLRVELLCKDANGNLPTEQDDSQFDTTPLAGVMVFNLNCTGGGASTRVPYKVSLSSSIENGPSRRWGLIWENGRDANTPTFDGEGYYGGTQSGVLTWGNLSGSGRYPDPSVVTCSTAFTGGQTSQFVIPHIWRLYSTTNQFSDWDAGLQVQSLGLDRASCDFIVRIDLVICAYVGYYDGTTINLSCEVIHWTADQYVLELPYGDGDPQEQLCKAYPTNPDCYEVLNPGRSDSAIVCTINAEGDFLTWIVSWAVQMPAWVNCMVVPRGWDRSGLIQRVWENGPIGGTLNAFQSAIPQSIGCGPVGNIPWGGTVVALNTCDTDFAPGWVKTAIGWLIVLACGVAIVRRIMWSIGGGK